MTDRISVIQGDSREVLKSMADCSVDSGVMDPPYALVSIVKRFGKAGAAPAKGNAAYTRASAGFMGQQWDTGDTAFDPEFWAEVLRVLKPGAHLLAFSGTRTYHRLACAIEDAGFEIRDQVQWLYGSGFPKSHDVSKGIDRAAGRTTEAVAVLKGELQRIFETSGLTLAEMNNRCGFEASGYLRKSSTWTNVLPSAEKWWRMRDALGSDEELSFAFSTLEREIIGERPWNNSANHFVPGANHRERVRVPITIGNTDAAREWHGWGTALKPACEPIVLARKPLSERTVAANVLKWGVGALNIDGCRIATDELTPRHNNGGDYIYDAGINKKPADITPSPLGRWPANIIHDGSPEVVALFPDSDGQQGDVRGTEPSGVTNGIYGEFGGRVSSAARNDSGSAARFFYTAKADADDRLGSKHPTVKPVDLMQYLVRLVTPKGGLVIDAFAGTGTTGEAAFREGMRAVLIEREEAYVADIHRRIELLMAGPDERKRSAIKEKIKDGRIKVDSGPLFGGEAA